LSVATVAGGTAAAQPHVTAGADVLLYGDNTEFHNSFREGETILGSAARVYGDFELNPRVKVSLGVIGNERFGGDRAFEQVRPIVALTVTGTRSSFVFGAFRRVQRTRPSGPIGWVPTGCFRRCSARR